VVFSGPLQALYLQQDAVNYLIAMPDITAFEELLRLYDRWAAGGELAEGFAPFKHLFAQLRVLPPWGPQGCMSEVRTRS
jgi:hypothetical protein